MVRAFLRQIRHDEPADILESLTRQQYLHPNVELGQALSNVAEQIGFCEGAAGTAVSWLHLDPRTSIGRLRRTELTQLANSIHRFWMQAARGVLAATR